MTYRLQVQPNVPYRVWLRAKASGPGEKSGSIFFLQFSGAVDKAGREFCPLGSNREWILLRTPPKPVWTWIGRDLSDPKSPEAIVTFRGTEGQIRITAGSEGAFDQVVLSPLKYLEKPPADALVPRPPK